MNSRHRAFLENICHLVHFIQRKSLVYPNTTPTELMLVSMLGIKACIVIMMVALYVLVYIDLRMLTLLRKQFNIGPKAVRGKSGALG